MTWFRVDDGFAFHPKVVAAVIAAGGNSALGLWVRAGAWCSAQLTDGFIPDAMIVALNGSPADAEALASALLWTRCEAGWRFHDWEVCNPTRAGVQDRREKRAAAGRAGGIKSGQSRAKSAGRGANPVREASAKASASRSVRPRANPRPDPIQTPTPTELEGDPAGPPAVPDDPADVNPGHVVAVWTFACQENGVTPSTAQRGQVGRIAREVLISNDPWKVIEAARVAGVKGYASIDRELTALNGKAVPRPTATIKRSTTDDRVEAGADLKRQMRSPGPNQLALTPGDSR